MTGGVTPKRKPENIWAGAQLKALREKAELTQLELVEGIAGLDRSLLSNFETGAREITLTYAERLAPRLKVRNPAKLLPQKPVRKAPELSPLDRLAAAEDELAWLKQWVTLVFEHLEVSPELKDEARRVLDAHG